MGQQLSEGGPESEASPALDLDQIDDEKLTQRLQKLPALVSLFENKSEKGKDTPKKVEGGGQPVKANEAGDAMTELVTTLVKGIKAASREEARKGDAPPRQPPKLPAKGWRQRFWGAD